MEDKVIITPFDPIIDSGPFKITKYHMYNVDLSYDYKELVSPNSTSYYIKSKDFSLDKFTEFIDHVKTDEKAWVPIKISIWPAASFLRVAVISLADLKRLM